MEEDAEPSLYGEGSRSIKYPALHPDLLQSLVHAVREPLIVCEGQQRAASGLVPGKVITANPMACALLNRDLESVQSTPLNHLVATASGRPPPHGLVSKCVLHCSVVSPSRGVRLPCLRARHRWRRR